MATPSPDDSADVDADRPDVTSRFVLVTGPDAGPVGRALAARIPGAAHVDGAVVAAMLPSPDTPESRDDLARTFLRYTAGIALADTFRIAGHDTIVSDDVPPNLLEDYLDFAAPTHVHVVRVAHDPRAHDGEPGVQLEAGSAQAVAERALARLDEAVVTD